jgi:hypothetical protein
MTAYVFFSQQQTSRPIKKTKPGRTYSNVDSTFIEVGRGRLPDMSEIRKSLNVDGKYAPYHIFNIRFGVRAWLLGQKSLRFVWSTIHRIYFKGFIKARTPFLCAIYCKICCCRRGAIAVIIVIIKYCTRCRYIMRVLYNVIMYYMK